MNTGLIKQIYSMMFSSVNMGFSVVETKVLEGYEDFNLQVCARRIQDLNENIPAGLGNTYVFKISHPSTDVYTVDLQNQMLLHLSTRGIKTCMPQISSRGLYTEQLTSPTDAKMIFQTRLLHYVNGVTFEECGRPLYLLRSIGEFVGKICTALKTFKFDNYKPTSSLFELSRAPEMEEYIRINCSGGILEMAVQILHEYKRTILPVLHKLQQGFIHGDINSRNIILKRSTDGTNQSDYVIAGIIDLGDACRSFYIYEIAVVMADMMSTCFYSINPLDVGKRLLAGIREHFTMTELELSLLKLCICVRLLQVHVLIENIIKKQEAESKYFEKCRVNYVEVCRLLWRIDNSVFTGFVIKGRLTK